MRFARFLPAAACAALIWAAPPPSEGNLPRPVIQAVEHISANSMKGHVSFLASDLLEGRNTPSRGLDIAAEYIAAQFRRIGLETIPGTSSYFQTANWKYRQVPLDGVKLAVELEGKRLELDHTHLGVNSMEALQLDRVRIYRAVRSEAVEKLKDLPDGKLEGMVILIDGKAAPNLARLSDAERGRYMREADELNGALQRLKPAAIISVRGDSEVGAGARGQLIDPANPEGRRRGRRRSASPFLSIYSGDLANWLNELPVGETEARLSVALPEAKERPVALRNVIGVLPGSDPLLKSTYILVTAHYDHIGTTTPDEGDGIYNGANDDASGTASVMELASMFASLEQKPKRTLVFMTVFGEEEGLLGAMYYSRNPVFPLSKTVANINLEHMGRTDSTEGPQVNRLSMTGFDFSNVAETFQLSGKQFGVEILNHATNSDAFFDRSDNAAFAQFGVPAHTLVVAYDFADYHSLSDHWEKLDYENMARVNRAVATGLWMLAENKDAPQWNETNIKTEKYREARKTEGNKTVQ